MNKLNSMYCLFWNKDNLNYVDGCLDGLSFFHLTDPTNCYFTDKFFIDYDLNNKCLKTKFLFDWKKKIKFMMRNNIITKEQIEWLKQ